MCSSGDKLPVTCVLLCLGLLTPDTYNPLKARTPSAEDQAYLIHLVPIVREAQES